jgi:hypothetical protein
LSKRLGSGETVTPTVALPPPGTVKLVAERPPTVNETVFAATQKVSGKNVFGPVESAFRFERS